eukprot:TRINITY_DN5838_c0_g1_i3.p2 TRINITY_DN5838_c0_g1~~TRINITY_DN5838_c0_g1_i3.p2  ORF type:complete len:142 (+),score=21.13 TRINITY_DN5838_c0_g1_i3:502-927(+)
MERGLKCPLHGDGSHKRSYLYVEDVVNAYDIIFHKGHIGEVYNISSSVELSNLELAHIIIRHYGRDPSQWIDFVEDRRVNDQRYHIIDAKLRELGWKPQWSFEEGLIRTIEWYRNVDITDVWGPQVNVYALVAHPRVPHKL